MRMPTKKSLRQKQSEFTFAVGRLIGYVYSQGYELTHGDAAASRGHKAGSFHYKRLAIDFNLFRNGVYLTETSDHEFMGIFWEKLGGTWGGRFSEDERKKDGNHYSWGE